MSGVHTDKLLAVILSLAVTVMLALPAEVVTAPPTQAQMGEMFRALALAYKLSLDQANYEDPANRQAIQQALEQLSKNASALDQHTQGWQPSSAVVRRSLVEDSRSALERYQAGQYRASRFSLNLLTENCFGCHSKLPQAKRSVLGKAFVEDPAIRELAPDQQAQLAVVTRQFDKALAIYESMFKSASLKPQEIALRGAFEDYLKISIRVYGNFDRPLRTFEAMAQRPDLPRFLVSRLRDWIASLEFLRKHAPKGDDLDRARSLIRKAKVEQSYPGSREGLVDLVTASGALQRYLASANPDPAKVVEAYYLLGVAEAFISRSHWLSETEFFLETSIRMDPKAPTAQKAFEFLEEYTLLGYSGSSGTHIPANVRATLDELRDLIGEQQGKESR